jgi:GPH family glycoside/pentoside/hexuronide:cation symporter
MKLSVKEKVGYGLGDTASNFVWALMMDFIMTFYTDIYGLGPLVAGTMLLWARVADGAADFAMGAIADRTRTKWGRFRPYLVWMSIPLAVVFILTFTTTGLTGQAKVVYAYVTYFLLMLLYTAINIPYGALSGVMTDDPGERNSLNGYRMALAQIGGVIARSSFFLLIDFFGRGNKQMGAQWTVITFAVLGTILFLICFYTTKERIHPPAQQKSSLKADLKSLIHNPHWVVMVIGAVITITFAVVRGTAGVYYVLKYTGWSSGFIAVYFIIMGLTMAFGASLSRFIVDALGKKQTFIYSMALLALTALPFYWIDRSQTALILTVQIFANIVAGINASLYWSMLADTADYSEWKFNIRNTGIVFSAATFSQKVGLGLGAWVTGYVLAKYSYDAEAKVLSETAAHGVQLLMSWVPFAGQMLVAVIYFAYGITEDVATQVREDLFKRRAAEGNPQEV